MTVLCPASMAEQQDMLRWAVKDCTGPVAVRYPRGTDGSFTSSDWETGCRADKLGAVKRHREGSQVTLITYGTMINQVLDAAALLAEQGIDATVLRLQTVSPLPVKQIAELMSSNHRVVVVEEISEGSGIRKELSWALQKELPDCEVNGIDLGRRFAVQGDMQTLYKHYGLDAASIADYVREVITHES